MIASLKSFFIRQGEDVLTCKSSPHLAKETIAIGGEVDNGTTAETYIVEQATACGGAGSDAKLDAVPIGVVWFIAEVSPDSV